VLIIACEIRRNAQQAGSSPFHTIGYFLSQLFQNQPAKLSLMVKQPVQINQSLVDDILMTVTLVLDNDSNCVQSQATVIVQRGMSLKGSPGFQRGMSLGGVWLTIILMVIQMT